MSDFDLIVLGGGVIGAATARAAAVGNPASGRPPARVLLLDAHRPGHRFGSSHGDGRIVRFTYPEAIYLAMAKRAYAAWAEIEHDCGRRLVETTGGWESAPVGHGVLAELEASLAAAEIPLERLDAAASRRRFPHFTLSDRRRVLYQPEGAVVRADSAVESLWRLTEKAGGVVAPGHRVESLRTAGDGVVVSGRRADGEPFTFRARRLVLAAGGWTGPLARTLGLDLPLVVSREVVAYFAPREDSEVDHRVGRMPTLIDYDDKRIFYALPQLDIPGIKLGGHHRGPETRADDPPQADPTVVDELVAYAKRRFPHVDPEPIQIVTCLYTNTPDYHFLIDRHPRLPQIILGAGFSGHGFKFGPVVGDLLAQLAADRAPTLDLDLFRLDRLSGPVQRRSGA